MLLLSSVVIIRVFQVFPSFLGLSQIIYNSIMIFSVATEEKQQSVHRFAIIALFYGESLIYTGCLKKRNLFDLEYNQINCPFSILFTIALQFYRAQF